MVGTQKKNNSQGWDSKGGNCCQGLEEMTKNIDHGDVDNCFESSQELISNHGTKDGGEVAEHGKGVVDDS